MIIFADVHLREESADTVLNEVLPGIYQACVERKDFQAACLGDLLHFRYKIDARIQNALKDEFRRWNDAGIQLRIIPGNHDQYDVSGRNALEIFDEMKNVLVYSQPTWDKDGLWIPYRKNTDVMQVALQTAFSANQAVPQSVLFLHHGVQGSWMNDNIQDKEGLPLSLFGDFWQTILCGHYHKHQKVGKNLWYIGSPWQTNANEANQTKGYAVWDGKILTPEIKRWGPRFHCFELIPGQELDLTGVEARDEVRVKVIGVGANAAAEKIGQQLAERGVAKHVVTPEIEAMQARLAVPDGATVAQYAQAYVTQFETDLNKERLMKVYGELAQ